MEPHEIDWTPIRLEEAEKRNRELERTLEVYKRRQEELKTKVYDLQKELEILKKQLYSP